MPQDEYAVTMHGTHTKTGEYAVTMHIQRQDEMVGALHTSSHNVWKIFVVDKGLIVRFSFRFEPFDVVVQQAILLPCVATEPIST